MAEALAKQIKLGYDGGAANVLLATAPDHTGRMRPEDVEQLRRLGEILAADSPQVVYSLAFFFRSVFTLRKTTRTVSPLSIAAS